MDQPRLQTLAEIEAALWHELSLAPRDKAHAWRTPVLATTDGEVADARTVVLREVDRSERRLTIYSDSRAAKVAHLQARPLGTLVLWSRRLSWQLRLRVHLQAETEGLAVTSRWALLKVSPTAQDYLSPLAPGVPLPGQKDETPPATGAERGYLAVITATVLSVDWLELHPAGHRRARFSEGQGVWLTP